MALIFQILLLVLIAVPYTQAQAQPQADADLLAGKLPKIEAGFGILNFFMPDFPGSDETRYRFLPAPYLIYRGDVLRADKGLRARFLNSDLVAFDFSVSGSLPADSEDNEARKGMPEIDWMGEGGPRAKVFLYKSPRTTVNFELPVRYVFSVERNNYDSQGFTFYPELHLQRKAFFDDTTFLNASVLARFGTEKFMDYFYEVDSQYVTTNRPEYDADGGFLGWQLSASLYKEFNDTISMFIGASKSYYAEAENRSSPLLADIETESYFLGFIWKLYKSKDLVDREDEDNY